MCVCVRAAYSPIWNQVHVKLYQQDFSLPIGCAPQQAAVQEILVLLS